jgi:hypothetical protein
MSTFAQYCAAQAAQSMQAARSARNAAINLVAANERKAWRELHDRELAVFLSRMGSTAFLPEDFRRWFLARGNKHPHHPNVWGAMWMSAARQGLVAKTGRYRHMQDLRSHARITAEWAKP